MGRLDIVKARDWNPNQRQAKTRHTVVHRWMKENKYVHLYGVDCTYPDCVACCITFAIS